MGSLWALGFWATFQSIIGEWRDLVRHRAGGIVWAQQILARPELEPGRSGHAPKVDDRGRGRDPQHARFWRDGVEGRGGPGTGKPAQRTSQTRAGRRSKLTAYEHEQG